VVLLFIMGRDPVELAKRAKYQPPAMRVRSVCYTKKSPFRYNQYIESIRDILNNYVDTKV